MEDSILLSTKKILGLAEDYTVFDHDLVVFINGALSTAEQAGVGLISVLSIEDAATKWEDLELESKNLAMLKNYVFLKSKMLFDPPPTSFAIEAMNKQIEEFEWRMRARADVSEEETV